MVHTSQKKKKRKALSGLVSCDCCNNPRQWITITHLFSYRSEGQKSKINIIEPKSRCEQVPHSLEVFGKSLSLTSCSFWWLPAFLVPGPLGFTLSGKCLPMSLFSPPSHYLLSCLSSCQISLRFSLLILFAILFWEHLSCLTILTPTKPLHPYKVTLIGSRC